MHYWVQETFPQMYMQALLGPATVGRQIPFSQVTSEAMSVKLKVVLLRPLSIFNNQRAKK